mmetsp:Transcript_59125/g.162182  ORF Transcript_59125/g.162182 Transcript_59125/m.162182 type:complete len:248 (+) Transcript_59125:1071-1814(+)
MCATSATRASSYPSCISRALSDVSAASLCMFSMRARSRPVTDHRSASVLSIGSDARGERRLLSGNGSGGGAGCDGLRPPACFAPPPLRASAASSLKTLSLSSRSVAFHSASAVFHPACCRTHSACTPAHASSCARRSACVEAAVGAAGGAEPPPVVCVDVELQVAAARGCKAPSALSAPPPPGASDPAARHGFSSRHSACSSEGALAPGNHSCARGSCAADGAGALVSNGVTPHSATSRACSSISCR